jgi:hypothetical protein
LQIVAELDVTDGNALTITIAVLLELQPREVPLTVYTVLTEGLTETLEVLGPKSQVYVFAPDAVSVVCTPAQMVDELTDSDGKATTVTIAIPLAIQPTEEVPVTV